MKEYSLLIQRYAKNYDIRRSDVMNLKSKLKKAALIVTAGADCP